MQSIYHSILAFLLMFTLTAQESKTVDIAAILEKIEWFGQSSIKISTDDLIIYIDPFRIHQADSADMILITHEHRDHFDPASIANIATEKTTFVAPASCRERIEEIHPNQIYYLNPGDSIHLDNVRIQAIPAYNIQKNRYHPKSRNYLGYLLNIEGIKIFRAGDTERIPEMKTIQCHIAMLPIGQKFTMNSIQEAAEAVLDVKAKYVIPIHWGFNEGTIEDVQQLEKLLKGKATVITLPDKSGN